jgi:hypothetical protein
MSVEIEVTNEFKEWYDGLSASEQAPIHVVVEMLREEGVALPFPYCSSIRGSRYGLRELRPKRGRSPLRPFYAFDPARAAVLIFGGTKGTKLYTIVLARAERIWVQYLQEFKKRGQGA